jgi:coenzyme F420-0:L-glutamate ligase / coenzyme F420-1:gamma-L-glutamate ligase
MKKQRELRIVPLPMREEIARGDSIGAKICQALSRERSRLQSGDILVIKHKIVSKAEGAIVRLEDVHPSAKARAWAARNNYDARVTQLALDESRRIVRQKRNVLITETHHGFICANSGVDVSNVDGGKSAVLLPKDPDRSARRIRSYLRRNLDVSVPVIISDSFGRPWREGLTEVAIGIAGLHPLHDYRGLRDEHGYALHASVEAVADELACGAGLVCGKLARVPVCIIRGFSFQPGSGSARQLIRPAAFDLFR